MTILLTACVELSPAGAQVQVLREEQSAELSACQILGEVAVSSQDALRNAAAAMSGDTALMSVRDTGGNFYIRGTVYRCAREEPVKVAMPAPVIPQPVVSETDTLRKSAKCRDKGGLWNGSQCVIEIE